MAAKKTRPRSARARGLRTLQHQTLPSATRYGIDTEVWFRGIVTELQPAAQRDYGWATKDQVHDEAIEWFVGRHAQVAFDQYPARRVSDEDVTFWVDSKLMERARRMATRDGVKVARLIDAALSAYVREHLPADLIEFRRRVQREAAQLYQGGRRSASAARRTRR